MSTILHSLGDTSRTSTGPQRETPESSGTGRRRGGRTSHCNVSPHGLPPRETGVPGRSTGNPHVENGILDSPRLMTRYKVFSEEAAHTDTHRNLVHVISRSPRTRRYEGMSTVVEGATD